MEDCTELYPDEQFESLWVIIKGHVIIGDTVVDVY